MAISKRWAANGIKTPIPNDPQGDNLVNYDEGFTPPYRTPIKDGGVPIRLDIFNQLIFDITDEVIGIKSTINQLAQQFNGLIDDTQTSLTKTWSSQFISTKLNTGAIIDDTRTSLTTTWSSQLISTKLSAAAAGAIIDDNTISTDKTWSSSKIKGMLDGKCAFSVGNWERQESSQNTTITNTTDKTKMVNLNVKVKTNAAANRYLGDVVVYYNTPSREVLRQSCVSQNIANTTDLTTAMGMTMLGPQDSLIIQSTPANGVLDFWNNVTLIGNISSVLCSRPEPYDWLIFTAKEANSSVTLNKVGSPTTELQLEYRTNTNVEWQNYTLGTTINLANIDDWVEMRNQGLQTLNNTDTNYHQFAMTGKIAASGNIQYLLDKTGELLSVGDYCYYQLFSGCTSLITAPELPATTLANSCYIGMFLGCTSLTTAPELPATTLANSCYKGMFQNCQSLTTAPELPATTLADSCYNGMFAYCSNLTTAPNLPATTLANSCYLGMFLDCASLTTAPSLPATTLANSCYFGMFENCQSLTTAPSLPATTLADSCYCQLFNGCTSLTTAPELPATTLANNCYKWMFHKCTSLTTAPSLPATTLADSCYFGMFLDCASLTTAPSLPATTLADSCYNSMFAYCSNLTTAPELPATTLADSCYLSMFLGCTSLKVNQNGSGTKIFTCPSTSGLTDPISSMFYGTGGSFTGDPTTGNTYNWY